MARKEGDLNPGRRNKARADSSERPAASVNMDELRELIALLRENGLAEFELERADFRVRLRRESTNYPGDNFAGPPPPPPPPTAGAATPQPAQPAVHHPGAQAETAASEDSDLHIISSPIVGTFYRSPSPTADPFVKIGTSVEAETVVCIIEAM